MSLKIKVIQSCLQKYCDLHYWMALLMNLFVDSFLRTMYNMLMTGYAYDKYLSGNYNAHGTTVKIIA